MRQNAVEAVVLESSCFRGYVFVFLLWKAHAIVVDLPCHGGNDAQRGEGDGLNSGLTELSRPAQKQDILVIQITAPGKLP